jgi:hypothetical protein
LIATLFPERTPREAVDFGVSVSEGPPPKSLLPWVTLGGSAVLAGAGLAFGSISSNSVHRIEQQRLSAADFKSEVDAAGRNGAIADVLFTLALGGAIAAVGWLLAE